MKARLPPLVLAAALACGACIPTPTPRPAELVPDADAAADADAPDPGEVAADADATGAGEADGGGLLDVPTPPPLGAWPPADVVIGVRQLFVEDLDRDGVDEMIVGNLGGKPDDWGFFVRFGGAAFAGQYHAFVRTEVAAPGGLWLADLFDDARPEVLVLGSRAQKSWLLVYGWDAAGAPALALSREVTFWTDADHGASPLDGRPVFVSVGRFRSPAALDVVFGDLFGVGWLAVDSWSQAGLEQASYHALAQWDGRQWWSTVVDALPTASAADGVQDLLVVDEVTTQWLHNDGSGVFGGQGATTLAPEWLRGHDRIDVDGDAAQDVLGWKGERLVVLRMTAPAAGGPAAVELPWWRPEDLDYPDDESQDASVGQLDSDPRPDIAIVDDATGTGWDHSVRVLMNVFVDGTDVFRSPTSAIVRLLSAPAPWQVVVGDFDGDGQGEVHTFAFDGQTRCYLVGGPPAALVDCP